MSQRVSSLFSSFVIEWEQSSCPQMGGMGGCSGPDVFACWTISVEQILGKVGVGWIPLQGLSGGNPRKHRSTNCGQKLASNPRKLSCFFAMFLLKIDLVTHNFFLNNQVSSQESNLTFQLFFFCRLGIFQCHGLMVPEVLIL